MLGTVFYTHDRGKGGYPSRREHVESERPCSECAVPLSSCARRKCCTPCAHPAYGQRSAARVRGAVVEKWRVHARPITGGRLRGRVEAGSERAARGLAREWARLQGCRGGTRLELVRESGGCVVAMYLPDQEG